MGAGEGLGVRRSGDQGCRDNRSLVGRMKDEGRKERGHPRLEENGNGDKRKLNEGQAEEGESEVWVVGGGGHCPR